MKENRLQELADLLGSAWEHATTVPAPTRLEPGLTVDDAYAIQELIISRRTAAGRRVVGWKMGLTSASPPTEPIVGALLDDMVIPSGTDLGLSGLVGPMVEAEVVVRIGEAVQEPQSAGQLRLGPHQVGGGIEVIDYRTTDSSGAIDWVADNSTVAYAVVGELVPVSTVDTSAVEASLSRDETWLATGRSDKVMEDPLEAVAWLSRHLVQRGRPLQRGDVILTGSLTGHHRVPKRGVAFSADFGHLGTVSVRFHA